jgi:hypothetical protein
VMCVQVRDFKNNNAFKVFQPQNFLLTLLRQAVMIYLNMSLEGS